MTDEQQQPKPRGLARTRNRVILAVVAFELVFVPSRSIWAGLLVALFAYLLALLVSRASS